MNKVIQNTALSLLGITILSSLLLSSTHVFSDTEVIDEVRLTVPVACTMTGTGTTHTATLNPGTYSGASGNEYENGIGKTTLTAICNDDNGFSIYAIGFTGNGYGVTNLIGQNTSGTIATKAYESGDTTSNWSMKLTKVDNPVSGDPVTYNPQNLTITTSYDTWHAVPAEYTKVAQYKANTGSSTTDTTLGVKLETTYAAYIASNQPADTYIGQVKYTMVHPYNAIKPANVTCNPNASTISEAVCMQDFAGPNGDQIASTMTLEQKYTLRDKRDNKTYTIARTQIPDDYYINIIRGHKESSTNNNGADYDPSRYNNLPYNWRQYGESCNVSMDTCDESLRPQPDTAVWMMQDLDLDIDSNVVYTNEDTDIGFDIQARQYKTATWKPNSSTYASDDSSWQSLDGMPESYDPGDFYSYNPNDYSDVNNEYENNAQSAMEYLNSCSNDVCDESVYNQLPNDWQIFVGSCGTDTQTCDFSLMPVMADPYTDQMNRAEMYISSCQENECQEGLYDQLNNEMKQYIDSCDAEFENCNASLKPYIWGLGNEIFFRFGEEKDRLSMNYYNWTAAIASNDSSVYSYDTRIWTLTARQSICPAGWTMPKANPDSFTKATETWSGVHNALFELQDGSSSLSFHGFNGVYVGHVIEFGSTGSYWSATTNSDYKALSATFQRVTETPSNIIRETSRNQGLTIRCIARPVSEQFYSADTVEKLEGK